MPQEGPSRAAKWGVACACSVINFLILGPPRLSGMYFVESITRYGVGRKSASFVFLLHFLMRFMLGPVVGYLGRKFGLRSVTFCGCIFSSIGLGACFFAENIIMVIILYGCVYGFAVGMANCLISEILNEYFDKHVSKANGISLAGSSICAMVLPPIAEILIKEYGLSGTFLIISALILNTLPAAMFLRKPVNSQQTDTEAIPKVISNCSPISCTKTESMIIVGNGVNYNSESNKYKAHNSVMMTSYGTVSDRGENTTIKDTLKSSQLQKSNEKVLTESSLSPDKEIDKFDKGPSAANSFKIFLDPIYILIMLTQSIYFVITTSIWTVIVDIARDKNIASSNETYLVMSIPVWDLIARLTLGAITDSNCLTVINFLTTAYVLQGLTLLFIVWSNNFVMLLVSISLFGFVSGGQVIVFPAIINEFVHKDDRTMGMASRFVLYAPMSLCVPSLIGYFRGTLGSYNYILYLLGFIALICSIITICMPPLAKLRSKTVKN